MKFIYDSLDTVKHIKRPTRKDYINLTLAILFAVIVAWAYFIFADSVFSGIYKFYYNIMS
jgi:preprotein translocase SecE subunit